MHKNAYNLKITIIKIKNLHYYIKVNCRKSVNYA